MGPNRTCSAQLTNQSVACGSAVCLFHTDSRRSCRGQGSALNGSLNGFGVEQRQQHGAARGFQRQRGAGASFPGPRQQAACAALDTKVRRQRPTANGSFLSPAQCRQRRGSRVPARSCRAGSAWPRRCAARRWWCSCGGARPARMQYSTTPQHPSVQGVRSTTSWPLLKRRVTAKGCSDLRQPHMRSCMHAVA